MKLLYLLLIIPSLCLGAEDFLPNYDSQTRILNVPIFRIDKTVGQEHKGSVLLNPDGTYKILSFEPLYCRFSPEPDACKWYDETLKIKLP